MRNRFERRKNTSVNTFLRVIPIVSFAILFICFVYGTNSIANTTAQKQLESLENAVHRSIIQCYCVEGMYPPSLDYLKEHYGLVYDETSYLVDYQPTGANLPPDVTILPLHHTTAPDTAVFN